MAQWQAPSTNNERARSDLGVPQQATPRAYLLADGHVHWWSGLDVPAGSTRVYVVRRASDGRRVFSTDNANEVTTWLFGTRVLIR